MCILWRPDDLIVIINSDLKLIPHDIILYVGRIILEKDSWLLNIIPSSLNTEALGLNLDTEWILAKSTMINLLSLPTFKLHVEDCLKNISFSEPSCPHHISA